MTELQTEKTGGQKFKDGARDNAGALGAGLPVIAVWALTQYAGLDMPVEVATAVGGIAGAIGGAISAKLRSVL